MSGWSETLQWVKIEDIKVPNVRLDSKFSPEEYEEFLASIKRQGQLQPIIVVKDRETGELWLVDGRNRLEALRALGHKFVRAEVRAGKLIDAIVGSATHNLRRGRISVAKLAELVRYLHHSLGWSLEKIAEELGYKSKGYISNLVKVAEDPKLLKMAEEGRITLHDVTHLDEVLRAEPISYKKASFEERSPNQGGSTKPIGTVSEGLTDESLNLTTSLKEALESGKRFKPLSPEDLEPKPVRTKSAVCDFCGRKVLREELRFLRLHAQCYDEVVDILEGVKAEREAQNEPSQP
ncbi:MAG: ParB/RepB/Spo0J family partition protein [Candidatus Bathyarchaeia archaeon]